MTSKSELKRQNIMRGRPMMEGIAEGEKRTLHKALTITDRYGKTARPTTDAEFVDSIAAAVDDHWAKRCGPMEIHPGDAERLCELARKGMTKGGKND